MKTARQSKVHVIVVWSSDDDSEAEMVAFNELPLAPSSVR